MKNYSINLFLVVTFLLANAFASGPLTMDPQSYGRTLHVLETLHGVQIYPPRKWSQLRIDKVQCGGYFYGVENSQTNVRCQYTISDSTIKLQRKSAAAFYELMRSAGLFPNSLNGASTGKIETLLCNVFPTKYGVYGKADPNTTECFYYK